MSRLNHFERPFLYATLPVQLAIAMSRPSRPWDLLQRQRSRQQRRLSVLRSKSTRLAQGLLKRLAAGDRQRMMNRRG